MAVAYRYVVLTLCTLAFTATMVARLAISPVVPDVIASRATIVAVKASVHSAKTT